MDRELLVFADLEGVPVHVGRLWARARGASESASFEYERSWLASRSAFSLDPELPLAAGQFHTERALFNAFTDPAPDRWGQTLLRRHEVARAKKSGQRPRTLLAVDFLSLVDDETRLGALRFRDSAAEPFLSSTGKRVPPLIHLPRLLAATARILEDKETAEDLQLVLAPGTSLGGARPKASVLDSDGILSVAKFPSREDDWPVTRWEAATLMLARAAGVVVPDHRLQLVLRQPVLLLRRFDRRGAFRVPFMSALTALSARDNQPHSYLELFDVLRREGAEVEVDLRQLWRRLVFNVLVSSTDDHLRNHAFLREPRGWRLAPAYDVNPMPADVRPRVHALALDEADGAASLESIVGSTGAFGLGDKEARSIAADVGRVVKGWRKAASRVGLTARQIERMESAFEHDDLKFTSGLKAR